MGESGSGVVSGVAYSAGLIGDRRGFLSITEVLFLPSITEVLFLLSSFVGPSGTGIECETGLGIGTDMSADLEEAPELGTDMSVDLEEAPGSNNLSKAMTEKVGISAVSNNQY